MRTVCFAAMASAVWAAPAMAQDVCADLWFTRNLIFDRAGYCFMSALGSATFDNAGCTAGVAVLGWQDQATVDRIAAREAELACAIDSDGTGLDLPNLAHRKALTDLPVAVAHASSCIGWTGGRLPLRIARDDIAPLASLAENGDTLVFRFEDAGAWRFAIPYREGNAGRGGWVQQVGIDDAFCTAIAD